MIVHLEISEHQTAGGLVESKGLLVAKVMAVEIAGSREVLSLQPNVGDSHYRRPGGLRWSLRPGEPGGRARSEQQKQTAIFHSDQYIAAGLRGEGSGAGRMLFLWQSRDGRSHLHLYLLGLFCRLRARSRA